MLRDYELTNYDFYSSRRDMEIISTIVDALNKILEEDKKEEQPLFLRISDNLIMDIARKVVQDKKKTFLIGITGESASGRTRTFIKRLTAARSTFGLQKLKQGTLFCWKWPRLCRNQTCSEILKRYLHK